ncbi:hypothetical protein ACLKA7_004238 [Drosophila subpalustris]
MFFAIWTIVHGVILLIIDVTFFALSITENHDFVDLSFLTATLHLIAGILMLVSIKKSKPRLHMASIVLSSIYPFAEYVFLHMPVMQVIFIIIGCRYYSTVLK